MSLQCLNNVLIFVKEVKEVVLSNVLNQKNIEIPYLFFLECECNPYQFNEFKKGCNFAAFFFENNKHA